LVTRDPIPFELLYREIHIYKYTETFSPVLRHCWLDDKKDIQLVLVCWWWYFDWSFARLIFPVVTHYHLHHP